MTQLNPTLQDLRTHMVRDIDRQLHEFQGSTDRGSSSFHGTSARMGLSQRELETYSFSRAINEIRPGVDKHNNCLEWEVSRELAKRFEIPMGHIAIPMDVCEHRTMNAPSYLIGSSAPEGVSIIDTLRNLAIVYRLGAQRLTGLQNDVNLPRMTADPSVTWLAPGGSAVASDPAVGQILASPKIGVTITEVDEQMLKQSAADQIVSHSLASALAVGIDKAAIAGAGGVEPLGITNTPGIGSISGASLPYSALVAAQRTVGAANAILDPSKLGYAGSPETAELMALRQRFSNTDTPFWMGSLHEGEVVGARALSSKQVPASTLIFGDWSSVNICEFGPLMLASDNGGTRFNEAKVGIRAMWLLDVFLTAPQAFVKITGIS
ncbi:MAG: phage major capsid protein [Nitrospira sp.]|jgi:hypothetical protein|nr:phage major capsid protein [Nitrospira sp.]